MKPKLALFSLILLIGMLAAALLPSGCGGPTEDPAKFVGYWAREYPPGYQPSYPETIEFRGDGTAARAGGPEPHTRGFTWTLYRDKLVLAPREGGERATYDFRFDGVEKLTLIDDTGEITLNRAEKPSGEPAEESPDQPSAELPEGP